jgi:hypothetical protein
LAEEQTKQENPIKPIEGSVTINGVDWNYEDIKRISGIQGTQKALASILNCVEGRITQLKNSDPKFAEALEIGAEYANSKVKHALFLNATKEKDTAAMRFWLTNRCKNEFAELSKQEINAKVSTIDELVNEMTNKYEAPIEKQAEKIAETLIETAQIAAT